MAPDRNHAVDAVRTAALIGICIVNLPFMGLPLAAMFEPPAGLADRVATFVVAAFFEAKFFLLFSFVFGWGVHVQEAAASASGAGFAGRYGRRLLALGLIGALHAVLVFVGDILVLYALLGLLLWPVIGWTTPALLRLAAWMVPVAAAGVFLLALALTAAPPAFAPSGLGGSFADAVATRATDWPATFFFLVLFQGALAYAAFAAGLAAGRAHFFDPASAGRRRLLAALPWLLALGVPLNLFYAAVATGLLPAEAELANLFGFLVIAIAGPMLSAAYLCLIVETSGRIALPATLVRAGRNSLTAYVLQGAIGGLIFGGYGLGLFGTLGQAALLPLAVAVALAAMLITGAIAGRFGRGPLEALLRAVTYGRG
jgi:uncharacterized protein